MNIAPALADIASRLETAGAGLAALQTRGDVDPLNATNAYAALLAARAEVRSCVDGPSMPSAAASAPVDLAALARELDDLVEALGDCARTHAAPDSQACARAALYVDDARAHLIGEAP